MIDPNPATSVPAVTAVDRVVVPVDRKTVSGEAGIAEKAPAAATVPQQSGPGPRTAQKAVEAPVAVEVANGLVVKAGATTVTTSVPVGLVVMVTGVASVVPALVDLVTAIVVPHRRGSVQNANAPTTHGICAAPTVPTVPGLRRLTRMSPVRSCIEAPCASSSLSMSVTVPGWHATW